MSIAVSSALPSGSPAVARLARRIAAVSTMHLAGLVLIVLVGGILASILTTTDPLWWQLHFSQLGTFHDTSGALFNNSLKIGGLLVVVFAVRVRADLVRLGRSVGRRGGATVAQLCLSTVGIGLALVGCVPLNSDKDLHDKVAAMMVLGFASLLVTSPVMLHRMPKRMMIATATAFVVLFGGAWLFVDETISLALFEVICFGVMFAWSGVFTKCLALRSAQLSPAPDSTIPDSTISDAALPVAVQTSAPVGPPLAALPGTISLPTAILGGIPAAEAPAGEPLTIPAFSACAVPVGSAARRRSRRPSSRSPRGPATAAAHGAPALLRRGCTASAARAASGKSTTPDRR